MENWAPFSEILEVSFISLGLIQIFHLSKIKRLYKSQKGRFIANKNLLRDIEQVLHKMHQRKQVYGFLISGLLSLFGHILKHIKYCLIKTLRVLWFQKEIFMTFLFWMEQGKQKQQWISHGHWGKTDDTQQWWLFSGFWCAR